MSMIVCEGCDAYIDSDDDCDCFVEVGNMKRLHQTKVLCERCRDEFYSLMDWEADQADRQQAEGGI